jgi:hypothetical protein
MKRLAIVALLGGAIAVGGTNAQAQEGTGQLTLVHAATFDAGNPFPVTVCLDDALVDGDFQVGERIVTDLPAGTYTADIYVGAGVFDGPECAGSVVETSAIEPALSGPITIVAGEPQTVVAAWNNDGPNVLAFETDTSCAPEGSANVSAVHAATAGTVDIWAGPAGGELAPFAPGFAEGELAGPVSIPEGDYDIAVFPEGADPTGTPAIAVDGLAIAAGTSVTIYAIGGNDGALGAFALVDEAPTCPPTETTVPVEPTEPQPEAENAEATPAAPVPGQANFTG